MGNSPWRSLETGKNWDSVYQDELIQDIGKVKVSGGLTLPRILLWGQIKAGKSSFINSVASIDEGRMAYYACAESAEKSCTTKFKIYKPRTRMKNFILLDMMGLQATGGVHPDQSKSAMEGNILPGFEFDENNAISDANKKFFKADDKLSLHDKVHCSMFMVDAKELKENSFPHDLTKKFHAVKDYAKTCQIATLVLLTNIDSVCSSSRTDVKEAYQSNIIRELVQQAHLKFGVSEMNIFPVKNYTKESELKTNMNILILLAVRHAVRYASDHIASIEDQNAFTNNQL